MLQIRQNVRTFTSGASELVDRAVPEIREDEGKTVATYTELVRCVAELAFANPEFVLLYRGQAGDYRERDRSTLFSTMFRQPESNSGDQPIYAHELRDRYRVLNEKEERLIEQFRDDYEKRFSRNQLLRWAILQHYEVCPTPLLDVTHSLLVACSFALPAFDDSEPYSYLYVLGLPQISGSVTVVSDQSLQIVRLSSVCPPTTLRPYFQEGYLLSTFPMLDSLYEKAWYTRQEVDGANRLIAKFRLRRDGFWGNGFERMTNEALYPNEDHPFNQKIHALKG